MSAKFYHETIAGYEVTIKDYGYKSKAPICIRVSGSILGERVNAFGEPCYFYECESAYTMAEGIARAKSIVENQLKLRGAE